MKILDTKIKKSDLPANQNHESMGRADVVYEHQEYAAGRWRELSLCEQMGNIGSEVSRAFKWREKNPARAARAAERALELFDLTIDDPDPVRHPGKLREVCLAREEFCAVFYGSDEITSTPAQLQKYYDEFATLAASRLPQRK